MNDCVRSACNKIRDAMKEFDKVDQRVTIKLIYYTTKRNKSNLHYSAMMWCVEQQGLLIQGGGVVAVLRYII